MANGRISWEHKSSYTSDLDEEIEKWHRWLHKVTTLNFNMMIRSLHCVATEVRDLPMYDGLTAIDDFLNKFEQELLKQRRFYTLKWALRTTPARYTPPTEFWGLARMQKDDAPTIWETTDAANRKIWWTWWSTCTTHEMDQGFWGRAIAWMGAFVLSYPWIGKMRRSSAMVRANGIYFVRDFY